MLKLASDVATRCHGACGARQPQALGDATRNRCCCRSAATSSTAEDAASSACWSKSDRIGLLPEIRQLFDTLKDGADGVARAHIISAFPVDDSELASLKAALEKRFGKKIEATVERRSRT